jgi:hypothetical protein
MTVSRSVSNPEFPLIDWFDLGAVAKLSGLNFYSHLRTRSDIATRENCMVIGTTLYRLDGNPYYSPEFGRGGLAARFAADVTQVIAGIVGLTISVEHRNSEDTTWATLGSFSAISATGAPTVDLTGCKEIVRFVYTFDATDVATAAVHFLMQEPSWRPY